MLSSKSLLAVAAAAIVTVASADQADAGWPYTISHNRAQRAAATYPWHGGYQHIQYGAPVALVVPPTAHMRQTYSWGVSQNLMYPIHHQFGYDAPASGGLGGFRHAPPWPSHTDQFGVYYVRGPW